MYKYYSERNRKGRCANKGPKGYKPQYPLKRMYWEFHAYDRDFSPSVPHGHSGKYRLDVITGAVIDSTTGIIIGYLDRKDFLRLLNDDKFQELVLKARAFYLSNNPGAYLPEIGTGIKRNAVLNRIMQAYPINSVLNKSKRIHGLRARSVFRNVRLLLHDQARYVFKAAVRFKTF
jgi:hypothetical protein